MHITTRGICQCLIANYTCSSRSSMLKRIGGGGGTTVSQKLLKITRQSIFQYFSQRKTIEKHLNEHVLMESSLLEDKVTRDEFNGEHHIHPEIRKVKIKRRVSSSDIITNMFPGNETRKTGILCCLSASLLCI